MSESERAPSSSEQTVGERVAVPKVGDVIVCAAFANGWRNVDNPDGAIWVTDAPAPASSEYIQHCRDEKRGTARFVVEESCQKPGECVTWRRTRRGGGYGDPFEYEEEEREYAECVLVRRLAADGSYDPEAETVKFRLYFSSEAIREVKGPSGHWMRAGVILEAPICKVGTMRRIVAFV